MLAMTLYAGLDAVDDNLNVWFIGAAGDKGVQVLMSALWDKAERQAGKAETCVLSPYSYQGF